MADTRERNGVRLGQPVVDVDGRKIGRVDALYDWGFLVVKGFPILFRQDQVLKYDEIRGVRSGALMVARSNRDLQELAAGAIPVSWRIPVPPGFPSAATPGEARQIIQELAAERAATAQAREEGAPGESQRPEPEITPEDERVAEATRGQIYEPPPSAHT